MAGSCTKCGAPLTSTTSGFCSICGAPIGTAVAASIQAAPPSAGDPPVTPAKSSGDALKVILLTMAVMAGIGILGAGAIGYRAWSISKPVSANGKSNDAMFSIPGLGSISTGSDATADPTQLGAPIYPGAVQAKGAVAVGTSKAGVAEAHFTTGDSVSQVADFYAANLAGAVVASTGSGAVINAGPSATDRTTVTITPGSGSNAGTTTIVIVRTTKN